MHPESAGACRRGIGRSRQVFGRGNRQKSGRQIDVAPTRRDAQHAGQRAKLNRDRNGGRSHECDVEETIVERRGAGGDVWIDCCLGGMACRRRGQTHSRRKHATSASYSSRALMPISCQLLVASCQLRQESNCGWSTTESVTLPLHLLATNN